jgi:hypothetical protein
MNVGTGLGGGVVEMTSFAMGRSSCHTAIAIAANNPTTDTQKPMYPALLGRLQRFHCFLVGHILFLGRYGCSLSGSSGILFG